MRTLIALFLITSLAACDALSSPEGRSKLRDENLEVKIAMLEQQNADILDSIKVLNSRIQELHQKN